MQTLLRGYRPGKESAAACCPQQRCRGLCHFVTLLSRKGLKALLLEFIISVVWWGMCWCSAATREAAQNCNFLCFRLFLKNVKFSEKSFMPLSAWYALMKDGRKPLLVILP